jgi:hypothetical protein
MPENGVIRQLWGNPLMNDLLKWIATYSPSVAVLLVLGAGVVFVFKIVVERAIDAKFAEQTKLLELRLQRRSAFEERVLLDRYQLVTQLSNRLEDVRHNIARVRSGTPAAKDFQVGQDIPSLTAIHGELKVNRSILIRTAVRRVTWRVFPQNSENFLPARH